MCSGGQQHREYWIVRRGEDRHICNYGFLWSRSSYFCMLVVVCVCVCVFVLESRVKARRGDIVTWIALQKNISTKISGCQGLLLTKSVRASSSKSHDNTFVSGKCGTSVTYILIWLPFWGWTCQCKPPSYFRRSYLFFCLFVFLTKASNKIII